MTYEYTFQDEKIEIKGSPVQVEINKEEDIAVRLINFAAEF